MTGRDVAMAIKQYKINVKGFIRLGYNPVK
jgi:hypothetical protein